MHEEMMLALLRYDLQRIGADISDSEYLKSLLWAAEANLNREGIRAVPDYDYAQVVVGTAAWMYRKRINGEAEPAYLRRMRHDLLLSQKMGGAENA